MTHRMNLALGKVPKALDKKDHESITQNWSIPEGLYELTENEEALSPFITITVYATTMRTIMTINSKKKQEITDFKFDTFFFIKDSDFLYIQ